MNTIFTFLTNCHSMIKQGDFAKIKPHGAWTGLNPRMRVVRVSGGVSWLSAIHFIDGREVFQKHGFNKFVVGDFLGVKNE